MGVKIKPFERAGQGKEEPADPKPLFEPTEDAAPSPSPAPPKKTSPVKPSERPYPPAFHLDDGSPPTPGWEPMDKAPRTRPILVACQSPQFKNKWAYDEVQ